jgi:hypothetical protein
VNTPFNKENFLLYIPFFCGAVMWRRLLFNGERDGFHEHNYFLKQKRFYRNNLGIVKNQTGETIKFDGPHFILDFIDSLSFLPIFHISPRREKR